VSEIEIRFLAFVGSAAQTCTKVKKQLSACFSYVILFKNTYARLKVEALRWKEYGLRVKRVKAVK
jgi:hypothetical protein